MDFIKVRNLTNSVWVKGLNNGSIQINSKEEAKVPYHIFVQNRSWFEELKSVEVFDFEFEDVPPPEVPNVGNTKITLEDINSNTGTVDTAKEIENKVDKPSTLTEEEIKSLDDTTIDKLREYAKRIGAAPSRRSSELLTNIKTKLAEIENQ